MTRGEERSGRRNVDPAGGRPRAGAEEQNEEEEGAVDARPVEEVCKSEKGEDEPVIQLVVQMVVPVQGNLGGGEHDRGRGNGKS